MSFDMEDEYKIREALNTGTTPFLMVRRGENVQMAVARLIDDERNRIAKKLGIDLMGNAYFDEDHWKCRKCDCSHYTKSGAEYCGHAGKVF